MSTSPKPLEPTNHHGFEPSIQIQVSSPSKKFTLPNVDDFHKGEAGNTKVFPILTRNKQINYAPEETGGKRVQVVKKKNRHQHRFYSSVNIIPHPEKKNGGEDAYFISPCGSSLGVADGVGGWSDHGVDSGLFSRELMMNANRYISLGLSRCPKETLLFAYENTNAIGTSTACIMNIEGSKIMASNLGDSGFIVFRSRLESDNRRHWSIVLESEEQQHYFNCPRQLGTSSFDKPSDSVLYNLETIPGDLVLLGTDGLFDNVSKATILNFLNSEADFEHISGLKPEDIKPELDTLTRRLSDLALMASQSRGTMTPFAISAQAHGLYFVGGKMDDVTVMFAWVGVDEKEELVQEEDMHDDDHDNYECASSPNTITSSEHGEHFFLSLDYSTSDSSSSL